MLTIVLVEPKIPPNTGTIARLCAANYLTLHLVGELGFSLDDTHLKRAGLDYWPEVNYQHFTNTNEYMTKLNRSKAHLFTTKASQSYTDCHYQKEDILVFGSETTGLSEDHLSTFSDRCRTIPMQNPAIRSLNLSNAVSIVSYEALRQLNLRVT
ncbi:tRNA (uridine(34)/cytosine(34)/5-carboxymethylaminomethyluridine(34)-2'-O)-methyltransferase TrmL [Candidatus Marinamargulisbacteria bacterium SCGC AG-439-L15]|nr:tRNA (uridine(34)/cytosine(34)/5-carboxymethylaminomethyluridine(34)-2'-O)-methyltransferase TrmL [Candidatus Marinamargulisbacteria bacterium SCGC AG-439-L15]